jgi:NAD(P)-dependent dehydrogenase (short-subunit alcohol dehydrogenase family)
MTQRVLITAGASGIGREFARAFAKNGAKVFVCDIDGKGLAELAKELTGIGTQVCDVSKRAEVEKMVAAGVAFLGGLDVLINNAGIAGPTAPVESMDPDEWEKVMNVNLNGTFNVTRHAIPHLKKSPAGSIIIMSSAAGRFGYPNRSPYATTKWGLVGLAKTLSIELGEFGIRVNAILPGGVIGPRMEAVFEGRAQLSGRPIEEIRKEGGKNQSLKEFVDPRDIAAFALFLTSDHGKTISGQALAMDGDMQKAV